MADAKQKLIDKVVNDLNKQFGKDCLRTFEDKLQDANAKGFIPVNNLALEYVIGRRGLPWGRVIEIAGKSGSGKSSLVASIIGAAQQSGAITVLHDLENSYDPSWARRFGVNGEDVLFPEPETLEEVFDLTRNIISTVKDAGSDVPMLICVDSISAAPTAAELEQEDSTASKRRAEHATVISMNLRKLTKQIKDEKVTMLFVSQLKDNPNSGYGVAAHHKLGGSAIQFHAGLQLELARISYKTEKEKRIGINIQVNCVKNKFVSPFRKWCFDLYYDEGFKPKEILLDFLTDDAIGFIKEKSGWYEWEGSKYRKGDMVNFLTDEMYQIVYEKLGIPD